MRDLDRYLGDGGMPLLAELGVTFTSYAPGSATATWTIAPIGLNPAGGVQAGVHAVVLDAAMSFALVASLEPGAYGATLNMSIQTITTAHSQDQLDIRGSVTHIARTVAYCSAEICRGDSVIATAHGTFAIRRRDGNDR